MSSHDIASGLSKPSNGVSYFLIHPRRSNSLKLLEKEGIRDEFAGETIDWKTV